MWCRWVGDKEIREQWNCVQGVVFIVKNVAKSVFVQPGQFINIAISCGLVGGYVHPVRGCVAASLPT